MEYVYVFMASFVIYCDLLPGNLPPLFLHAEEGGVQTWQLAFR